MTSFDSFLGGFVGCSLRGPDISFVGVIPIARSPIAQVLCSREEEFHVPRLSGIHESIVESDVTYGIHERCEMRGLLGGGIKCTTDVGR